MISLFLHSLCMLSFQLIKALSLSLSLSLFLAGFAHSPVDQAVAVTTPLEGEVGAVVQMPALHHQQSFPSHHPPQLQESSTLRWLNIATARRSYCSCFLRIPQDLLGCQNYFQSHGKNLEILWHLCHSLKKNRYYTCRWATLCMWTWNMCGFCIDESGGVQGMKISCGMMGLCACSVWVFCYVCV